MQPMAERGSTADQLLDDLLPEELDWQRLVRSYPLPALALAAVGGFFLGRSRGPEIVSALAGFAADTLTESVNQLLGKEVL